MKKILLTLAVGLVAGYAAAETVTTKAFLNRTGWEASGCTQHADGQSGYFPAVLDDNINTYWHSDWTACATSGNKHWLLIDMKSEQTVNGFDYLCRQTGSNGEWYAGKAYLYNEAPTVTLESAAALYNGSTQAGEFSGWNLNNKANYRTCTFPAAATGRYLLIITGSQNGNFSSCAELKPFALETREVTTATFTPVPSGDNANGTFYKNDGTTGASWSARWQPNTGVSPAAKIETVNTPNNIGLSNGNFDFRCGSVMSCTYQISSVTDGMYVSQVSFTATGNGTEYIQPGYGAKVQVVSTGTNITIKGVCGQPVQFTVTGSNQVNEITNLQITLSATGADATAIGEAFAQKFNTLTLWRPILGTELFNDFAAGMTDVATNLESNLETITNQLATKISDMMNEADGRPIYIQNNRRSGTPYFVSTSASTTNTTTTAKTNEAAWLIKKVDGTGVFKLYNLAQRKYVNANGGLDDTGTDMVLEKNTSSYPGTSFKFNGTSNGLNVDNGTNNGTTWTANDGGSSWTITLLGLTPSQITNGKYVRIRSARAIQLNRAGGSLLGVATALENNGSVNADVANVSDCAYGLGTIWKVEAVEGETNKFYLRNLAADFASEGENPNYMGGGAAYSNLPTSTNKGQFTFVSCYGAGEEGTKCFRKIPTAIAISNGSNYVDTNGHNNGMGTWVRCDNNWPNNGGLYFFEECADVETVKAAYIAKATAATIAQADNAVTVLNNNTAAGIGDFAEFVAEIEAAKTQVETAAAGITTVGQANLFKASASNPVAAVLTEPNLRSKATAALTGKHVLLRTRMVNNDTGHNVPYATVNADLTATDLNNNIADNARRGVWKLEAAADGKVAIRNEHAGKYLAQASAYNVAMPLVDTPTDTYYVHFDPTRGTNGAFAFTTNGNTSDTGAGIHCGAGIQNLCKWDIVAANSWFDLTALNGDVTPSVTANEDYTQHTISFGEAQTASVPDAVVITVRQTAQATNDLNANGTLATYTFHSSDVNGGTITIDNLPRGSYEVDVPAAFFTVDGKYNAPATYALDAATTGIAGINAEAKQVIFDLQGRRLNAPVRGINIINGRKVRI